MKKCLAMLLVLVMSFGTVASALEPTDMSRPNGRSAAGYQSGVPDVSTEISTDVVKGDPMLEYLGSLDPQGPVFPKTPEPGEPLPVDDSNELLPLFPSDAIFLYLDSIGDEWNPLPTREDLYSGKIAPVAFENGTQHEIHGKLFEKIIEENTTYYDDIGIPSMPIEIEFDGTPVAQTSLTGNDTVVIDPFMGTGNGTFQFILDFNKPAGEYELSLKFDGWPPDGPYMYEPLTYRAVIYVNHPSIIDMDVTPDTSKVGDPLTISGSISDDTGRPITSIPLQVWFDLELLGPTSDGVYIDDVEVQGTKLSDDFEDGSQWTWSTYSAPDTAAGVQWESGTPVANVGPIESHSGSKLWGTVLDGNYQRGAWSFLVSQPLNFTANTSYALSFFAWWSVYWEEDFAYVLASSDGGTTWDEANPMLFMGSNLIQPDWTYFEFDVTGYQGSDEVRFAFVFYSIDKTLDVRTDSTFAFQYQIPMDTTADQHKVTVRFKGNLLFRPGQSWEDVDVKRITHFEFEQSYPLKVGHRNNPVKLVCWLKDNMDEVPSRIIRGHTYFYQVTMYWDKTWTIHDSVGDRVGPPCTVASDTGEASINYVIDPDETLGPHNVTFRFPGDDYYTSVQQTDVYYVKAETYILPPPTQERTAYRGQTVSVYADLRIVIEQSLDPIEPGDPLSSEFVKIYWNGEPIANRRTDFDGMFSADYLVPSTHELGDVVVEFIYEGNSFYEPSSLRVNYTIISDTFIEMEDAVVHKGTWITINGTMTDDKGVGVPGARIYIMWKRAPEIARVTTADDGSFSCEYYIEYENKIGNVSVIARFDGNKIFNPSQKTAIYSVKVGTMLERRDRTFNIIRGESVEIAGKLYERWGSSKGVEVQRVMVTLTINGVLMDMKRTAFDGSVTFTIPVDSDAIKGGNVDLVLSFEGTEFYDGSANITRVFVSVEHLVTFAEIKINGNLFDPSRSVVRLGDTVHGRIHVTDNNFDAVPMWNVSVWYMHDAYIDPEMILASGLTDDQGAFTFTWTLTYQRDGVLKLIGRGDGVTGDGIPRIDLPYIVPPDPTDDDIIDTYGDHQVRPGATLDLEVAPSDPGAWNRDALTFALVEPPEGMVISEDGKISWTPTEDQKGTHEIVVWLYDGQNSRTVTVTVNVSDETSSPVDEKGSILLWMVGSLAAVIMVIVVIFYMRRRE
jgi:hypothetical protein